MSSIDRRTFVAATVAGSMAAALPAELLATESQEPIGPLLGHVDTTKAIVWFRAAAPGPVALQVVSQTSGGEETSKTYRTEALAEHDLCVKFTVVDLAPSTTYEGTIVESAATGKLADPHCQIRTPAAPETPAKVALAFGSCASSTKFFEIWDKIAEVGTDALVLMGDTPYIDKTDLPFNRQCHREFLRIPTLNALARSRPLWGTWDDHDFGGNDTDGKVKNKPQIRQAFCEYRALESFGDGEHGIYTKFRYGGVEVFMIDPRYFSQTEMSPVDPEKPTCVGKKQWEWLLAALEQSTAPFKVLATGMIWDDKENKEKDDWGTYAHERDAIFDFLGEKKISGVILLSGDIHVSRHLKYPTQKRVGYELHECIVSPLHDRIIPSLNIPHPALVWGEPIPNVFLQLTADTTQTPAKLTARWISMNGKQLHAVELTTSDLSAT